MAPAWPSSLPNPFSSSSSSQPTISTSKDTNALLDYVHSVPHTQLILGSAVFGALTLYGGTRVYKGTFRRIQNVDWVTPNVLGGKRWVRGVVTSVGDADNFRLYHTPGPFWNWPLKFRSVPSTTKALKNQTLHIRIAGVDAPEAAHFGKPAQPGSVEALAFLKGKLEGKRIWTKLVRKDQYSRIVGLPYLPPRFLPGRFFKGKPVAFEMLRAGHATTYEQAGAEYGSWGKDEFLRLEAIAKRAKKGMWKNVTVESPADYKKRMAVMDPIATPLAAEMVPPKRATKAAKAAK